MQLNNMTFKQLKVELGNSKGNPAKERHIRELMRDKYIRYLKYKRSISITKQDVDDCELQLEDFTNNTTSKVTPPANKFDVEIKRDSVNNNLMDRLNSDLYIKDIMKSTKKPLDNNRKNLINRPYEEINNNNTSTFLPFGNNVGIIPNNDFSNNRLLH